MCASHYTMPLCNMRLIDITKGQFNSIAYMSSLCSQTRGYSPTMNIDYSLEFWKVVSFTIFLTQFNILDLNIVWIKYSVNIIYSSTPPKFYTSLLHATQDIS